MVLRADVRHIVHASPLQILARTIQDLWLQKITQCLWAEEGAQNQLAKLFTFEEESPSVHQLDIFLESQRVVVDAWPLVEHILAQYILNEVLTIWIILHDLLLFVWCHRLIQAESLGHQQLDGNLSYILLCILWVKLIDHVDNCLKNLCFNLLEWTDSSKQAKLVLSEEYLFIKPAVGPVFRVRGMTSHLNEPIRVRHPLDQDPCDHADIV